MSKNIETLSITDILPSSIAESPSILSLSAALDGQMAKTIDGIKDVSIRPRVRELVNSMLIDLLAWEFHVDFYDPTASLALRRQLVGKSLDWHMRKGTPSAVEEVVTAVFSDALVEEWWEWGGQPYWFRVSTEDPMQDADEVRVLLEAIYSVKNTRSWIDGLYALRKRELTAHFAARQFLDAEDTLELRAPEKDHKLNIFIGVGVVIRTILIINMSGE